MKRYCKEVNILDMDFLRRCARDCLRKKWKRNDVTRFFARLTGWDKDKITNCIKGGNREILVEYAAQTMQRQLAAKKLEFPAIWYKEKVDSSSQKLRLIGIQNISQQLYDYVAVYAMEDLMRRIGEYQCASIPGRGPLYGVRHVQNWLKAKGTIYADTAPSSKVYKLQRHHQALQLPKAGEEIQDLQDNQTIKRSGIK